MKVVVPISPAMNFSFDGNSPTHYLSAPSSPKSFGDSFDYFYHHASAPTSPTRAGAVYTHFGTTSFDWGGKPGDDTDFSFDFGGQVEKGELPYTAADELFEAGMIRPLKPPPLSHHPLHDDRSSSVTSSPRSPHSPWSMESSSPCHRGGGERDGGKGERFNSLRFVETEEATRDGGRKKAPSFPFFGISRSRRGSRSLPHLREEGVFRKTPNSSHSPSTTTATSSSSSSATTFDLKSGGSKRWRLKNLLFFRSGSEGRASGIGSKDPLRKYTFLSSLSPSSMNKRSGGEDSRNASFRSSMAERGSKGGQIVSAHEIHYMENRAASEGKKKTTPLPYHRHGLFSYLRFNRAVHNVARAFSD